MNVRIAYLAAMAVLLAGSAVAAEVFCCGETYKFRPDGTVVEFAGKPPGGLAEQNAIFSKKRGVVSLAGARNETVAFQVVICGEAKDVSIALDGLKGVGEIPASRIEMSLISFVNPGKGEADGDFPDICVPLRFIGGKFDVPYTVKGLAVARGGQKVGMVLIEISIPTDAVPGKYFGSLKISGGATTELKVELTVWDFVIPAAPSVTFEGNSYQSPVNELGLGHNNPYIPAPQATIEAEHKFYQMFNRHRMFMNLFQAHSQRGRGVRAPALYGNGKDTKCDWTSWDKHWGPVLSGEIFEDKQPPPYFYLPFNLHWPYGYSHDSEQKDQRIDFRKNPDDIHKSLVPEWEETFKAVARQFVEHLAEKGYKQTVFQVMLNHKRHGSEGGPDKPNTLCPWRTDESYDKSDYAIHQWFAKLTNEFLRDNDKGVKIRYRFDIGHWNCRDEKMQCYKAKQWEPDDGEGMLEPFIDHWYITQSHVYGTRHRIPKLLAKGPYKEVFMYAGGEKISGSATTHRALMWYISDMGLRGYLPWTISPNATSKDSVPKGFDFVCYHGKDLGLNEPIPSFRMKVWRRSCYDAEYLKLAKAKDEARVRNLRNEMCPYKADPTNAYKVVEFPAPNNNPDDWELARLELAGIILGKDFLQGVKRMGRIEGAPEKFVDQVWGY
ncbi:MAG: hypothetical protein V1899_08120 [Planctomycetota bacterium]